MKRVLLAFMGLGLCFTLGQAKDASSPANFSGKWVLDFSQTKNPPAGLRAYTMLVNQNQQQLKVETALEGELQAAQTAPPNAGGYPGTSPGTYPGGRRGGMGGGMGLPGIGGIGVPGVGMGIPGGRGGRPRTSGVSQGNVAAYELYPRDVVYKLDGSQSSAQLGGSDALDAISKAEWAKNGEELKLSLLGNGETTRGSKVQLKDHWKVSGDGKSLIVERSVKSPEGSGTSHLVFLKRQ